MAGTRQHFIPRMLLQGFADASGRVVVLRRNGEAFPTSIKNIGLERHFYGRPGRGTPDESITNEEQRIAPVLKRLRDSPVGPVDSTRAAVLFAHFAPRTQSMRSFMHASGHLALDGIERTYSDSANIIRAVREYVAENIQSLMDDILREIRERNGFEAMVAFVRSPQFSMLRESLPELVVQHLGSSGTDAIKSTAGELLGYLRPRMANFVESAHHRVALEQPTPRKWVERLRTFCFEVIEVTDDLVLGDSVAWGIQEPDDVVPLYSIDDELISVVMPICRTRLLVGSRSDRQTPPPALCNDAATAASESFIVAHPELNNIGRYLTAFGSARARNLDRLTKSDR